MDIHTQNPAVTSVTTDCSSLGNSNQLTWRIGNAKLRKNTIHLSIPAGWTCKPWATECYTHAAPHTGKITDGKQQKFRCYAATMEAVYPSHRKSLWNNYQTLLYNIHDTAKLYNTLLHSVVPIINEYYEEHEHWPKIRIFGTSGDFWHKNMYLACIALATFLKDIRVYWYTKAIPLWIKYNRLIPPNLEQNASLGGRYDHLIYEHNLKYAKVVFSFDQARKLGLPIDKRDELASEPGGSFAIPLHGVQPKGSEASTALQIMKREGFRGYSKRKNP